MRRLYHAVCTWLEADAAAKTGDTEPQPEGNNFTQAETGAVYSAPPEMHAGWRGQSLDDDDGGAYRARRVGFTRR